MFKRFTQAATDLVVDAQAQRRALGDDRARTEHLLLALAADDGPTGDVLRREGIDADGLVARLATMGPVAEPGTAENDDILLKGIGIDVDDVRRSLDRAFGPGALDRARAGRRQTRKTRRGRAGTARNGGFDSRSKRVLELSLRESLRLKTKHIGPEHIGLAILLEGEGRACQVLTEAGVDLAELRRSWEAVAIGAAAR
jgi:ATP-dependent Clp protease ATP-binding subunit ClpA